MKITRWFGRLNSAERIIFFSGLGMSLFLIWASLAKVDEVARGQGRVIPSSKVQLIQAAEPSTIDDILVRSGQTVKKGQLLVRLDDSSSASELGQLETENKRLSDRSSRLEAKAALVTEPVRAKAAPMSAACNKSGNQPWGADYLR